MSSGLVVCVSRCSVRVPQLVSRCVFRLSVKRTELEAKSKAMRELEKSKVDALNELIKKKDEQIRAAEQGWVLETNRKVGWGVAV